MILANIYAIVGKWDEVAKVKKLMRDNGVRKEAGCNWIEVKKKVHFFIVGDPSNP